MNLFVVPSLRATQWRGNLEYKNRYSEFHISLFVIQRALSTTPRTKRVHSNSNRKNTFSDYEFSIFTLCSACRRISYKPKLSFRAVGEEPQAREKARPVRDISLSLKMTEYFSHYGTCHLFKDNKNGR